MKNRKNCNCETAEIFYRNEGNRTTHIWICCTCLRYRPRRICVRCFLICFYRNIRHLRSRPYIKLIRVGEQCVGCKKIATAPPQKYDVYSTCCLIKTIYQLQHRNRTVPFFYHFPAYEYYIFCPSCVTSCMNRDDIVVKPEFQKVTKLSHPPICIICTKVQPMQLSLKQLAIEACSNLPNISVSVLPKGLQAEIEFNKQIYYTPN